MNNSTFRKFVFFGGKGGTGKTTCAGAYALKMAREGHKALVISTDPAHSLADAFGKPIGPEIVPITDNLWGIEVDAELEAKKYMRSIQDQMLDLVSAAIVEEIKRQLEIAYMSPGAEEAAIFDKFIEIMGLIGDPYDIIIFDTAPTGHTLRLLTLPEILGAWIDHLIDRHMNARQLMKMSARYDKILKKKLEDDPIIDVLMKRKNKFEFARKILTDGDSCEFIFVLNAERMPILETERAIETLKSFSIPVGGVVVNRVIPPEAGAFFEKRRHAQEEYLKDIDTKFGYLSVVKLPMLETDIQGMNEMEKVADIMGKLD